MSFPAKLSSLVATFALPLTIATGCATEPLGPIEPLEPRPDLVTEVRLTDLDPQIEVTRGVSIDPRTGDFVFLTDEGILHVNRLGQETFRHDIEEGIFIPEFGFAVDTLTFGDIASLGDGTYALPMENMVRRYDPETNEASDYFCLEPGFEFQQMQNDAITLNLADNEIFATPRIMEGDQIISNSLVQYRASDASLAVAEALSDSIHPHGIALDKATDQLIAVEGNRAHILTRAGEFVSTVDLDGVSNASGAAIIADEDVLFVLDDTTATLVAFRLSTITQ